MTTALRGGVERDHLLDLDDPVESPARRPRAAFVLIVVALLLWAIALPGLGHARVSQYGLLASGSPLFLASMAVIAVAFVAGLRSRSATAAASATFAMILVQRVTPTLITQVPVYSWTYKHLGVVDYISHNGHLARDVDIYNSWPGLFAATAWFSDITGVAPMTLAHWFTPAVHVVIAVLVYLTARTWGLDRLPAVTAAFLVECLNWVGQDYYSPQATGLVLALGILMLIGLSRRTRLAAPLIVVLFTALTVTHQLTPYWLLILTALLALTRKLTPWWLPLLLGAIALGYLAINWNAAHAFTLVSPDPVANAKSNIATKGVSGQFVTSRIVRFLSIGMWTFTVLSMWLERRRRAPILQRSILAFSPFLILAAQGYGGEAIFRVFLYSLPGCALLIGPVMVRAAQGRLPSATLVALLSMIAVAASAQGYFGGWFANRMTREQVQFSEQLLDKVPYPAYLTVAAPVWPERPTERYVQFARFKQGYDYPMVYAAKLVGSSFASDADYEKFIRLMSERKGGPTYLIISRQMEIYDWYFGILPLDGLRNLRTRMLHDPRWTVVYDTDAFTVFKGEPGLKPPTGAGRTP